MDVRACIHTHMRAHMVFPLVNIHHMLQYDKAQSSRGLKQVPQSWLHLFSTRDVGKRMNG